MRFRARRTNRISITEHAVSSSGWDHSPESSPFLFTFSPFSLSHFPFLLESFDWHVSHHLIPSMTQVSFCTTMSIMFFMLSFELFFPGQSLLCILLFDKSLFQASLSIVIIHFCDYRLESLHWTFLLHDLLC